eukprot:COSAG06_NODE_2899_length_6118_cov_9.580495_1_plen_183_part_00
MLWHRGFAFVSFADEAPMLAACSALDGMEVDGRQIKVNQAQPRDSAAAGPDWICPRCKASCYASRRECFKCGAPRDPSGDREHEDELTGAGGRNWRERGPAAGGGGGGGAGGGSYGRPGGRGGGGNSEGGGVGRENNYKYNASANRNMERTVAEEAEEDDDARMRAYLARKQARQAGGGGRS